MLQPFNTHITEQYIKVIYIPTRHMDTGFDVRRSGKIVLTNFREDSELSDLTPLIKLLKIQT